MLQREVTVGRAPDSDILYDSNCAFVSNKHALLYSDGKKIFLRDTSTNGTYINGLCIHHQTIEISYGDKILLAGRFPLTWERICVFFQKEYYSQVNVYENNSDAQIEDEIEGAKPNAVNELRSQSIKMMIWSSLLLVLGIVMTSMSDTTVYIGAICVGGIYLLIGFLKFLSSL